jgi:hypothetical protein
MLINKGISLIATNSVSVECSGRDNILTFFLRDLVKAQYISVNNADPLFPRFELYIYQGYLTMRSLLSD